MPLDTPAVAAFLRQRAAALTSPGAGSRLGAPDAELTRSPAADRVAELALESGLFLYHFEHRAHLPLADDWLPHNRPELADPPAWHRGVLPEPKYQSFRHDLPLGSYHPGHRAKWATHELCHGLVGFAWRPDASPFFLATASRLAEMLPVVLWYTLDEAHLTRCKAHQGGGALFRTLCADCEAAAASLVNDADAERHIAEAQRYLDRELAAIARSRRLGTPLSHQFATLDLCSDGVAYAGAHGRRLMSPAFHILHENFLVEDGGFMSDLDALEARVLEVANGFAGAEVRPWAPTPEHGRWRWTLQDLAWRLLTIWSDTEGEAADALLGVVDLLADAVPATCSEHPGVEAVAAQAIVDAYAAYAVLEEEVFIPEPEAVFGVGYALVDGVPGLSVGQMQAGVDSALPLTTKALGDGITGIVAAFLETDEPARVPVGRRFAAWLANDLGAEHPLAEVARYEAELVDLPAPDSTLAALGPGSTGPHGLSRSAAVHRFTHDPVDLAEGLTDGDLFFNGETLVYGDGSPVGPHATALMVGANGVGEPEIHALPDDTATALEAGRVLIDTPTAERLLDDGWLRPIRWTETD